MVVPEPTPLLIQGNDEQVGTLQCFECLLTIILASERVAQGASQTVKNRSLQEKHLELFVLPVEHLLEQIVRHMPVAAGK